MAVCDFCGQVRVPLFGFGTEDGDRHACSPCLALMQADLLDPSSAVR